MYCLYLSLSGEIGHTHFAYKPNPVKIPTNLRPVLVAKKDVPRTGTTCIYIYTTTRARNDHHLPRADSLSLSLLCYTGIGADLVVHVGGAIYVDRGAAEGSPHHNPADRGRGYDRRLGHRRYSRSHSR